MSVTVAVERVERMLNRWIDESTPARDVLAKLEGRAIRFEIRGLGLAPVLRVAGGRAALSFDDDAATDVRLSAVPGDLARLAQDGTLRRLKESRAEINGDIHVAESFAELLRRARPELEHELSLWIGDMAAHEIGRAARAVLGHARRTTLALEADTAEYLQEEGRLLPGPYELRAWSSDVDRLRDDVERAAARLERLTARHARP